jgi:hypothetical protein
LAKSFKKSYDKGIIVCNNGGFECVTNELHETEVLLGAMLYHLTFHRYDYSGIVLETLYRLMLHDDFDVIICTPPAKMFFYYEMIYHKGAVFYHKLLSVNNNNNNNNKLGVFGKMQYNVYESRVRTLSQRLGRGPAFP